MTYTINPYLLEVQSQEIQRTTRRNIEMQLLYSSMNMKEQLALSKVKQPLFWKWLFMGAAIAMSLFLGA